jgi:hypothetical protein
VTPGIVNNNGLQGAPIRGTLGSFLQNWQLRARGHEKIRLTARRWIAFAVHEKTRRTDRASTLFNTTGFLA